MEHFPLVERLHTDVLEEKYGPIHAKVIRHDGKVREAHLVDSKGISRTYAITFFPQYRPKDILAIDDEIKKGGAIGKTFRKHGFAIRKNIVDVFVLDLPKWLQNAFKTKEHYAKARVSEFYAKKRGEVPVIYGTVVEVYTPDFRPATVNQVDVAQVSAPTATLEHRLGISKEDIWMRIGNENDYHDVQDRYQQAKKEAMKTVRELEQKIKGYVLHRK